MKVAGSHSCVGVIRLTGLITRLRLGPEVMGSLPIAQTVSPYRLNIGEDYREYDEGQQNFSKF